MCNHTHRFGRIWSICFSSVLLSTQISNNVPLESFCESGMLSNTISTLTWVTKALERQAARSLSSYRPIVRQYLWIKEKEILWQMWQLKSNCQCELSWQTDIQTGPCSSFSYHTMLSITFIKVMKQQSSKQDNEAYDLLTQQLLWQGNDLRAYKSL